MNNWQTKAFERQLDKIVNATGVDCKTLTGFAQEDIIETMIELEFRIGGEVFYDVNKGSWSLFWDDRKKKLDQIKKLSSGKRR